MIRLLVVSALFGLGLCDGKTCGKCPSTPKLYEELECIGVLDSDGCCFERFDCPDLKIVSANKCHYKGRAYNIYEGIDRSEVPPCDINCFCREGYLDSPAYFQCGQVHCPENFGLSEYKGCVFQHSFDGCCSSNKVCGDDKINELAKCELEGKTYSEGQKMRPEHSCHSCLCTKDFNSSIPFESNANCKKINCGIELYHFGLLHRGCVPVYYGSSDCCPSGFRCPSDQDVVMPIDGRADLDVVPEKTCTFGNHTLHMGQSLNSVDHNCVECTCKQPPMVECIEKRGCYNLYLAEKNRRINPNCNSCKLSDRHCDTNLSITLLGALPNLYICK